jgi:hypothetical protein
VYLADEPAKFDSPQFGKRTEVANTRVINGNRDKILISFAIELGFALE